jgi:hypothetical protein
MATTRHHRHRQIDPNDQYVGAWVLEALVVGEYLIQHTPRGGIEKGIIASGT